MWASFKVIERTRCSQPALPTFRSDASFLVQQCELVNCDNCEFHFYKSSYDADSSLGAKPTSSLIHLHRRIHVFSIMIPMSADFVEIHACKCWCIDMVVTESFFQIDNITFDVAANCCTFWQPNRRPCPTSWENVNSSNSFPSLR